MDKPHIYFNLILNPLVSLMVLVCLILPLVLFSQNRYGFEHIGKMEGLSQGTVNAIFQDENGLMWLGTNDGLNLYDGKTMTVFRYNRNNPSGLQSNHILSLAQDSSGLVWVGTFGGRLQYYNAATNGFYTPRLVDSKGENPILLQNIYSIAIENRNTIWVGTMDGLFRVDHGNKRVDTLLPSQSIVSGSVYALFIEGQSLWIGMEKGGLAHYDLESKKLEVLKKKTGGINLVIEAYNGSIMNITKGPDGELYAGSFGDYIFLIDQQKKHLRPLKEDIADERATDKAYIRSMLPAGDSNLWVATNSAGVQILNVYTLESKEILNDKNNPSSLSYNNIKSLFRDKQNGIWIGTNGAGIDYLYPYAKSFERIMPANIGDNGLSFNSVRSIYHDPASGNLWVGGYSGLDVFDRNKVRLGSYLSNQGVYSLYPDPVEKHTMWVGLEGNGLLKMDKRNGEILFEFPNDPNIENHIKGTVVHSSQPGPDNAMWIGTENALHLLDTETNQVVYYLHDPNDETSVPNLRKKALFIDSKERLWVGTLGGGLAFKQPNQHTFQRFQADKLTQNTLSSNTIYCVTESSTGQIYVGTNLGLNLFNEELQNFEVLTVADGLPNDVIYGILEDENGYMWMSTNEGISRFNPLSRQFTNFDFRDGLQANEFNSGAYFRDENGVMYFGGINGLSYFKPSKIFDNPIQPEILLTNLKINNQSVSLDKPIWHKDRIELQHFENNFALSFAALNFYKPLKNQYAYKFGDNSTWIQLGNKNSIEFINVKPGSYDLQIIASNNDGLWNETGITIEIVINPPFHETAWFYGAIGLLGVLLMLFLFRLRIRSIKIQKQKLEKEVDNRTHELRQLNIELEAEISERRKIQDQLTEANLTKDKFFSLLAHDLRSPFNALLGFLGLFSTEYDDYTEKEKKTAILSMRSSTQKLYNLIENLLTWSRSQRGIIEVFPEKIKIADIVDETIALLQETASQKSVQIKSLPAETIYTYADRNMIETVFRNLVSNAIKYSRANGQITIEAKDDGKFNRITFQDKGVGMCKADMDKLFRIDEQFTRKGTANESGTGLGLIICKEFVQKNNGHITVQSEVDKGTIFTVFLPKPLDDN